MTCTFNNTQRGSLTVVKQVLGGDGTFGFSSSTLPGSFELDDDGRPGCAHLRRPAAGSYDVTRKHAGRLGLVYLAICDNGDTPDSVNVGAGEDVDLRLRERGAGQPDVVKRAAGRRRHLRLQQPDAGADDFQPGDQRAAGAAHLQQPAGRASTTWPRACRRAGS